MVAAREGEQEALIERVGRVRVVAGGGETLGQGPGVAGDLTAAAAIEAGSARGVPDV